MKYLTKHLLVFSVLFISFVLSFFVLYTPIPNINNEEFSAVNVASYIKEISLLPHSVFEPENHEEVRLYIKDKLSEFVGDEVVEEMNYTKEQVGSDYDIKNLLAVIHGESSTGILLLAHYDSRGHIGRMGELGGSYGAADDGYGVATILEIARLYGERTDLKNSIYLLITDGEETGLYGASMASEEEDLMQNIGFVINLEARGIKGPAYMFETSTDNDKVIDFYKNANLPVSYSIATAVYTVMPNLTDFTEFLEKDKQGINFAVLDSLYYYHTPRDNYTNIDQSSIQHYGAQVMPLIEEFVTNQQYSDITYFEGTQDQVFFTLFANVFVSYTEKTANVLHIVVLVLLVALLIYAGINQKVNIKTVGKNIGYILIMTILLAFIGVFISKGLAFIGKTSWSLTYVRMDGAELPTLLITILCFVGVTYVYRKTVEKRGESLAFLFAGGLLMSLFAVISGFLLSGASFLFFIPSLFGLISLMTIIFGKKPLLTKIVFSITTLILILIIIPLAYSLFLALTVGGLAIIFVILFFYFLVEAPLLFTVY